jgi:hypothetical protein
MNNEPKLQFYVDFNLMEKPDVVVVRLDVRLNRQIDADQMKPDLRVILYDEQMECEAILGHGEDHDWVGNLLRETIRHLPEAEWGRLGTYPAD